MEPALLLRRLRILVLVLPPPLRPVGHRHQELLRVKTRIRNGKALLSVRAVARSVAAGEQGIVAQAPTGPDDERDVAHHRLLPEGFRVRPQRQAAGVGSRRPHQVHQ